ncbi:MAG TPA: hypothetical protein VIG50_06205 [Vicinamibacteria bacterium]|jgi:chromosome segregation ATPase
MANELGEGPGPYLDALERRIEEWTARVEALEARAADADPAAKADVEEGIDELWRRLDEAREAHGQLAEADQSAWARCRSALDQTWSEVEDAYSDLQRTLKRV